MQVELLFKDSDGDLVLIGAESGRFGFQLYVGKWEGIFPWRLTLSYWSSDEGKSVSIGINRDN